MEGQQCGWMRVSGLREHHLEHHKVQRGMKAPQFSFLSAASAGWDRAEISSGPAGGRRWRQHRMHRDSVSSDGPSVLVSRPHWAHCCAPGLLNRGSCLPSFLTSPGWSSLPQIPEGYGNERQVASRPPQQRSCFVFCLQRFVSLLF